MSEMMTSSEDECFSYGPAHHGRAQEVPARLKIWSQSHGGWVVGRVVDSCSSGRLTVEFMVDGRHARKHVLLNSRHVCRLSDDENDQERSSDVGCSSGEEMDPAMVATGTSTVLDDFLRKESVWGKKCSVVKQLIGLDEATFARRNVCIDVELINGGQSHYARSYHSRRLLACWKERGSGGRVYGDESPLPWDLGSPYLGVISDLGVTGRLLYSPVSMSLPRPSGDRHYC
eukprot:gnl/TRDRNA2_/TRDRNA2_177390_c0_seq15.p1 gnl/TRDRNA2_/TRDRNA2_177390_c0~~gnl/TRDRNA2_/TRDRNA2_177390_c0_seq15.p1  ORF type:complete len:230 (+),score=2.74 gnl/TRDRNA2_/TRDRNA2_177390_c0_seq15:112-801(+)